MRIIAAFFALSILFFSASAQTKKAYVLANGDYAAKPDGAVSYVLLKKLADTVYLVKQYDMTDSILMQGYYKDSTLSVPNGKFIYYQLVKQNLGNNSFLQLSRNVLRQSGYYANGQRNGVWVSFNTNGVKNEMATYQNDKLDGPYQSYNTSGLLENSGNYIDGKKDGNWDIYNNDGRLWYTQLYKDDKVIKSTTMYAQAILPTGFFDKIARDMGNSDFNFLMQTGATVILKSDEKGKVEKADILIDDKLMKTTVRARITKVLLAQVITPSVENGVPQHSELTFRVRSDFQNAAREAEAQNQAKQMSIISNHADQIGRGLNRVGQGKPITE